MELEEGAAVGRPLAGQVFIVVWVEEEDPEQFAAGLEGAGDGIDIGVAQGGCDSTEAGVLEYPIEGADEIGGKIEEIGEAIGLSVGLWKRAGELEGGG